MPVRHNQIAFLDQHLDSLDIVAAGLPLGAEPVVVPRGIDPLGFIAATMRARPRLKAVHVFAKGEPGALLFGHRRVDTSALAEARETLAAIGDALAPGGAIMLHGCRVAEGARGAAFLDLLAVATGADVAAAGRLVGAARGASPFVPNPPTPMC